MLSRERREDGIARFFKHPVYRAIQLGSFTFNCIHPEPQNLSFKLNPETLTIEGIEGIESKEFIYYYFKRRTFAVSDIKVDFNNIEVIEITNENNYVLNADQDIMNLFPNLRSLFCIDERNPWILSYGGSDNSGIRIKYKTRISPPLEVTIYRKQEDFQIAKSETGQLSLHSLTRNQFSRMQNIYKHEIIKEFNKDIYLRFRYITGFFLYYIVDGEYQDLKQNFEEVIFVVSNLEFPLSDFDLQVFNQEKHIYFLNFLPNFNGKFWEINDLMEYERVGGIISDMNTAYCSLYFKTKSEKKGTIHLITANLNLHFTKDFCSTYILLN